MRIWLLCVWILLLMYHANAQIDNLDNLKAVKGLPSDEVYDLLADSKGFIWAAHALGISRYDGVNFKDFNNPLATGAGITDILEDKQGRIWCHNFNGQVFYIENEQMYLLDAYKYKEEAFYPRMVILGDELLVTSQKGLFVLNTSTFSYKYIEIKKIKNKTNSIAIFRKKALIYNGIDFFFYKGGLKLEKLKFKSDKINSFYLNKENLQLQPLNTNDTIYARVLQHDIFKFKIVEDTVSLLEIIHEKNFVNTITNLGNYILINTKKTSYLNKTKYTIKNSNITDAIINQEGDTLFSSLDKGLMKSAKNTFWTDDSKITKLGIGITIRRFLEIHNSYIYGSQEGILLAKNRTSKIFSFITLPSFTGSIETLHWLGKDKILVSASVGIFLYRINEKKLYNLLDYQLSIKNIFRFNKSLLLANTNSLTLIKLADENITTKELTKLLLNAQTLRSKRCYDVTINPSSQNVLAAFSDGLHTLKDSTFIPILYKNEVITASSLLSTSNKTFVTTFNNGLFIIDKSGIRQKTITDGLLSNKVLKLKLINQQLFVIEQKNIQIIDINSEKIIKTIALPTEKSGVIYDLWQEDSLLYLSSNKALYKLKVSSLNNTITPLNYIMSVTSDTSIFPVNKPLELPYSKNNIQFKVISPSFTYPEYTYFNYRIKGNNDTSWLQTTTNESNIAFAALKPGDYTFEAYAVNFQNSKGKPINFQFTILKPWWQQWWFISLAIFILFLIIILIFKLRFKRIDQKNKEIVEKLALTSELRKSQLSTIVAQMNPHFIFNTLNTIQGLIYKNDKLSSTRYIGKFSELVRDILNNSNAQEITLSEEINHLNLYLELEKMRFEDELNITFDVAPTLDRGNIMLPPMLIQPYIENAIVHGLFHKKGSKNLSIYFKKSIKDNYLEILIDDNGIGREMSQQLNTQRRKHESFAISAIEKRTSLLNQILTRKIEISITDKNDARQNAVGTSVTILIPINNN